jgi:thermitase
MKFSRLSALFMSALIMAFASQTVAASKQSDILVKVKPGLSAETLEILKTLGETDEIGFDWVRVKTKDGSAIPQVKLNALRQSGALTHVQPNYKLGLMNKFKVTDKQLRREIMRLANENRLQNMAPADNPAIPDAPQDVSGPDPLLGSQWGMMDIGVRDVMRSGGKEMIVAVIDTGVDYTHEDLVSAMWRNPGEVAGDGIDNDGNGYVDDIVGWDFVSNDNLPYDLPVDWWKLLIEGGNPGHGTHCAGNVGGRADNSKGITGVASNVKIMAIRFLSEKGSGTTADAVKSIKYAVANKADVLSNSWGSEGEDPGDGENNQALKDAIQYTQDKGKLFIAAAGNGRLDQATMSAKGYDNDSDAKPAYPASYSHDTIVSVAALDVNNQLGVFSNWGARTVDIGAPGVKIFSTVVGSGYEDKVINVPQLKLVVYWDGTSMATPHVAGAAAAYWSMHPTKTWKEVKDAIITSATPVSGLNGKVVSGGKLDLRKLMMK